jgi:phosphate transport system substrate-binding protein
MKTTVIRALSGALLGFVAATVVSAEEIKISSGGAPIESIVKPVAAAYEKAFGDKLTVIVGGATLSFKVMDRGDSDIALAGSTFDDLLAALKKDGTEIKDKAAYTVTEIGKSQLHLAVNKDNPVKSLTGEQLKSIFTGKAQSWKEFGGPDEAIITVITTQNPATMSSFKKMVLGGEDFGKENLDFAKFDEIRNAVAANVGAIGFGPYTLEGPGTRLIETPAYTRPIFAITKGAPSAKAKKFIDYVLGAGKSLVKP